MPNTPVPAAAEGVPNTVTMPGITDKLSGMSAEEISAVNVVLRCLLCERFSECETARQLVQAPLSLLENDRAATARTREVLQ